MTDADWSKRQEQANMGVFGVVREFLSSFRRVRANTEETRALVYTLVDQVEGLEDAIGRLEFTMTSNTAALNAAIDDLSGVVDAALSQLAAEAAKIDDVLKNQETPEVDAATARIRELSATLKDKISALSSTASTVATQTPTADTSTGTVGAVVGAAGDPVPLGGVPPTPPSTAGVSAIGAAVPSTDTTVTAASPNQDTSGATLAETTPAAPGVATADTAPVTSTTETGAGTAAETGETDATIDPVTGRPVATTE